MEYAVPEGRVPSERVATFASYAHATRAVDYLADRRLALRHMAIVARDFCIIEPPGRSVSCVTAGAGGAISGAVVGAVVILLLDLFSVGLVSPGGAGMLGAVGFGIGAIVGTVLALLEHGVSRAAAFRTAVRRVEAARYDLLVTPERVDAARRLLGELAQRSAASSP